MDQGTRTIGLTCLIAFAILLIGCGDKGSSDGNSPAASVGNTAAPTSANIDSVDAAFAAAKLEPLAGWRTSKFEQKPGSEGETRIAFEFESKKSVAELGTHFKQQGFDVLAGPVATKIMGQTESKAFLILEAKKEGNVTAGRASMILYPKGVDASKSPAKQ